MPPSTSNLSNNRSKPTGAGVRAGTFRQNFYRSFIFRRQIFGILFVAPALLFFLVFSVYPTINGFYLSLTEYTLLKPPKWVGIDNYVALAGDELFRQALSVTAVFVIGSVVPKAIISLAIALVLVKPIRGRDFFKTFYFTPTLLSGVVISLVWKLLLDPAGLVNVALSPFSGGHRYFW